MEQVALVIRPITAPKAPHSPEDAQVGRTCRTKGHHSATHVRLVTTAQLTYQIVLYIPARLDITALMVQGSPRSSRARGDIIEIRQMA